PRPVVGLAASPGGQGGRPRAPVADLGSATPRATSAVGAAGVLSGVSAGLRRPGRTGGARTAGQGARPGAGGPALASTDRGGVDAGQPQGCGRTNEPHPGDPPRPAAAPAS